MSTDNFLKIDIDEQGAVQCPPAHVAIAMECVFPIFAQGAGKKYRFLGTGFFINHLGFFATAKHIIQDFVENKCSPEEDALCGIYTTTDNRFYLMPIVHASGSTLSDVSVGRVVFPKPLHRDGNSFTKSFPITFSDISVHTQIFTFAHPKTKIDASKSPQEIDIHPWFYSGFITNHYPLGRDKIMLPGNVYETSIILHGGSSGGPVFDSDGNVFAVNSTGITGTDVSYVSSIADILPLPVCNVELPDGTFRDTITIAEVASFGGINISKNND